MVKNVSLIGGKKCIVNETLQIQNVFVISVFCDRFGLFFFNTNLKFLYTIDIMGFEKFQQKIKLPPMGFEPTTTTITGLEF